MIGATATATPAGHEGTRKETLLAHGTPMRRRWTTGEIIVLPSVILSERLSPTALRLWIALAQFANDERQCWPSRRTLLKIMPAGTARATLRRARAELEEANLIEVEYRKDDRTGRETSPLYTLLIPVGEGDEMVPPRGSGTVPPEGDEMVPPLNLNIEPEQNREVVDEVRLVFDTWVEATGKHTTRTKMDDKRRRLISRALKDHPVEDVLDAVVGWRSDPFYRGENDRGRAFNDLGLLLRDAEHIERFRDLARSAAIRNPPSEPVNPNERRDPDGVVTHRFYQGTGWTNAST